MNEEHLMVHASLCLSRFSPGTQPTCPVGNVAREYSLCITGVNVSSLTIFRFSYSINEPNWAVSYTVYVSFFKILSNVNLYPALVFELSAFQKSSLFTSYSFILQLFLCVKLIVTVFILKSEQTRPFVKLIKFYLYLQRQR